MTSIIVVTHNGLEHTKRCLASVAACTDRPYEVIVVDNASTDDTWKYLWDMNVRVLVNDKNRGYAAACNRGVAAVSGSEFVLMNNDVVVTAGWLRRILKVTEKRPGLVGPCTNYAPGTEQQVGTNYGPAVHNFLPVWAAEWAKKWDGKVLATCKLSGFCLLITRGARAMLGTLDERFGLGFMEDDDWCRRADALGIPMTIALDAFVHHEGGASFMEQTDTDVIDLMAQNRLKYLDKWAVKV